MFIATLSTPEYLNSSPTTSISGNRKKDVSYNDIVSTFRLKMFSEWRRLLTQNRRTKNDKVFNQSRRTPGPGVFASSSSFGGFETVVIQ